MTGILFATNNPHKLIEVRQLTHNQLKITSLNDIACTDELPETQDTIRGNAFQKAWYIKDKYGLDCIADDTGLEVDALNGEPGVYSARYAGVGCSFQDNIDLLLRNMHDTQLRTARFKTVIALILGHTEYEFEGLVSGSILHSRRGTDGFGYDPIFQPEGWQLTFAEMSAEQKNSISHRGVATRKLVEFLNTHFKLKF